MTARDSAAAANASDTRLMPGTPAYRRLVGGVFLAGFAVFLVMYDTQGLLPQIGADLHVGESLSGWTVAASTLGMAVGMIPLSTTFLSRGLFTRMLGFLVASGIAGLAVAVMPGILSLIAARFLQGVLISVVPASALALISARVAPEAITGATGLYLAGNTVGGLFSRLGPGVIAELTSWRWAVAAMGVVCLLCAVGVWALRPAGRDSETVASRNPLPAVREALSVPGIVAACVVGMALMAAFNSAYTVVGFRLQGPVLALGPAAANLVFVLYLLGTVTSARSGRAVRRWGLVPVVVASSVAVALGYAIALPESLVAIVIGLGVITAMFFLGHSAASSTAARLAPAGSRSTASAVYLTLYYVGATAGSALGTVAYEQAGWAAAAVLGGAYAGVAALAAIIGRRVMRGRGLTDPD